MNRRDWYWLRWQLIRREALTSQWGWMVWNYNNATLTRAWTLDIWIGKTLWTLRRDRY